MIKRTIAERRNVLILSVKVNSNCGEGHLLQCITSNAASVFQVPALYTFGDLGRNTFRVLGLHEFRHVAVQEYPDC